MEINEKGATADLLTAAIQQTAQMFCGQRGYAVKYPSIIIIIDIYVLIIIY